MTKDIMTSGIEMSDVIKATGFPVPSDLEGKTFAECVSGGGGGGSGSASVYAWKKSTNDSSIFLNVDKAPDSISDIKILYFEEGVYAVDTFTNLAGGAYTKISDTQFQIDTGNPEPDVYERYTEDDVIVWEGEGGGNTTAYTWHGYFEDATQHQEMDMGILYFDFSSAPATPSDFMSGHTFDLDGYLKVVKNEGAFARANITEYTVSEDAIHMTGEVGNYRFVRDSSKDLSIWEASGDVTVEPLTVTENGTYTAPSGKAYTPVTVNVPSGVKLCAYYENDDGGSYYGKSFWSVTDLTPTAGASGTIPLIFADLSENGETNAVENVPYTSDGTYITVYGNNYFRAETMDKMLS